MNHPHENIHTEASMPFGGVGIVGMLARAQKSGSMCPVIVAVMRRIEVNQQGPRIAAPSGVSRPVVLGHELLPDEQQSCIPRPI